MENKKELACNEKGVYVGLPSHTHVTNQLKKPELICNCGLINTINEMKERSFMKGQHFEILRCKCGITLATIQFGQIIL